MQLTRAAYKCPSDAVYDSNASQHLYSAETLAVLFPSNDAPAKNCLPNLAMEELDSASWKVQAQTGVNGLVFEDHVAFSKEIGNHDCLIAIEASSLNYRDIMIANVRLTGHFIPSRPLMQFPRALIPFHCLSPSSQAQMPPALF